MGHPVAQSVVEINWLATNAKEPPPPFLDNLHNNGPSILMHVTSYSLQANTSDSPIDTTMDKATLTLHSHTASAPLHSHPSLARKSYLVNSVYVCIQ